MNTLRRNKMREFIESERIVTMKQLAILLPDVSLMTLHRDLDYLQDLGVVEKVRGGARLKGGQGSGPGLPYCSRMRENAEAKDTIAKKALHLLEGSESLLLDAGTTALALARQLPNTDLKVVAMGLYVALELSRKDQIILTVCGGRFNPANYMLLGTAAMDTLRGMNIDLAFLGASGYSEEAGFTCSFENEAIFKRLILERARKCVVLMDSSKAGHVLPFTFATADRVDAVVTELEPKAYSGTLRQLAERAERATAKAEKTQNSTKNAI